MDAPACLPSRLRQARESAGLTQAEAAARIGLGLWTAISRWERGERDPGPGALAALARAYGVRSDWLLGLTD